MITKYIQRHSVLARITHGVVAISCILLAITGLFVMITAWNNGVGSEFTIAMRWTHRLLAIPFILIPLLAIIISLRQMGCRRPYFRHALYSLSFRSRQGSHASAA